MLNPIHTRNVPLADCPFGSMDEVDEYVEHVVAVVKDAMGRQPEVSISLSYPDRSFPLMSRNEFRDAREELPFDGLTALDVNVHDDHEPDFGVDLLVTAGDGNRLSVRGRSVTRVDGVDVQVRKKLDEALDRKWEARDEGVRQRRKRRADTVGRMVASVGAVPVGPIAAEVARLLMMRRKPAMASQPAAVPSSGSRWRRLANNQWSIAIVGGAIAAAIAAGIVALVIFVAGLTFATGTDSAQSRVEPTHGASARP